VKVFGIVLFLVIACGAGVGAAWLGIKPDDPVPNVRDDPMLSIQDKDRLSLGRPSVEQEIEARNKHRHRWVAVLGIAAALAALGAAFAGFPAGGRGLGPL
jgi:hypothetical protein